MEKQYNNLWDDITTGTKRRYLLNRINYQYNYETLFEKFDIYLFSPQDRSEISANDYKTIFQMQYGSEGGAALSVAFIPTKDENSDSAFYVLYRKGEQDALLKSPKYRVININREQPNAETDRYIMRLLLSALNNVRLTDQFFLKNPDLTLLNNSGRLTISHRSWKDNTPGKFSRGKYAGKEYNCTRSVIEINVNERNFVELCVKTFSKVENTKENRELYQKKAHFEFQGDNLYRISPGKTSKFFWILHGGEKKREVAYLLLNAKNYSLSKAGIFYNVLIKGLKENFMDCFYEISFGDYNSHIFEKFLIKDKTFLSTSALINQYCRSNELKLNINTKAIEEDDEDDINKYIKVITSQLPAIIDMTKGQIKVVVNENVADNQFNLCLIHKKSYYQKSEDDPHFAQPTVQYITKEILDEATKHTKKSKPDFSQLNNILLKAINDLLIKKDIKSHQCHYLPYIKHHESYNIKRKWTFWAVHTKTEKKKGDNEPSVLQMISSCHVDSNGNLSFKNYINYIGYDLEPINKLITIYNKVKMNSIQLICQYENRLYVINDSEEVLFPNLPELSAYYEKNQKYLKKVFTPEELVLFIEHLLVKTQNTPEKYKNKIEGIKSLLEDYPRTLSQTQLRTILLAKSTDKIKLYFPQIEDNDERLKHVISCQIKTKSYGFWSEFSEYFNISVDMGIRNSSSRELYGLNYLKGIFFETAELTTSEKNYISSLTGFYGGNTGIKYIKYFVAASEETPINEKIAKAFPCRYITRYDTNENDDLIPKNVIEQDIKELFSFMAIALPRTNQSSILPVFAKYIREYNLINDEN